MARGRVRGGADSMSLLNVMLIILIVLVVVGFIYYIYLWCLNKGKMNASTMDLSGNKVKMAPLGEMKPASKEGMGMMKDMGMMGMFHNKDKRR
jgi:flagellar basal body-associated protein FliL